MDSRRLIWIPPTDGDGNPVDPRFDTAAYQLESYALQYRHDELPDTSVVAELLEEAVHRATKSAAIRTVENPRAYLAQIFRRLADRRIRKERRFTPTEPSILDQTSSPSVGGDIDRTVRLKEVYAQMDEKTREIVLAVVAGVPIDAIAKNLGVTPNTVSQRLKNGYRRLRKALHL